MFTCCKVTNQGLGCPDSTLNLSYDGGGALYAPPQSVFIFLLKISPPDQTLRPTCKFLILGLLYLDFFFLLKI